jgi:hypothetical protein
VEPDGGFDEIGLLAMGSQRVELFETVPDVIEVVVVPVRLGVVLDQPFVAVVRVGGDTETSAQSCPLGV